MIIVTLSAPDSKTFREGTVEEIDELFYRLRQDARRAGRTWGTIAWKTDDGQAVEPNLPPPARGKT